VNVIDRDGPIPVYKQIASVIREKITRGDLKPGEAVPSEAELSLQYGIARATARRVARELREQGLVYTVQGGGTFVGEPGVPPPTDQTPVYRRIAAEIIDLIKRGDIPPNRAIPSEKKLMEKHGVAKATARQAVAYLREQGWVFTVPYRGTYVTQPENWPRTEGSGDDRS